VPVSFQSCCCCCCCCWSYYFCYWYCYCIATCLSFIYIYSLRSHFVTSISSSSFFLSLPFSFTIVFNSNDTHYRMIGFWNVTCRCVMDRWVIFMYGEVGANILPAFCRSTVCLKKTVLKGSPLNQLLDRMNVETPSAEKTFVNGHCTVLYCTALHCTPWSVCVDQESWSGECQTLSSRCDVRTLRE